jgi:hypothetical protein
MEFLLINWNNTFVVVGLGIGLVMLILSILVLLLIAWNTMYNTQKKVQNLRPTYAANDRYKAKFVFGKKSPNSSNVAITTDLAQHTMAQTHNCAATAPKSFDAVAIAMALSLYFEETHDFESTIITFRPQKVRSAWTKFNQYE